MGCVKKLPIQMRLIQVEFTGNTLIRMLTAAIGLHWLFCFHELGVPGLVLMSMGTHPEPL